MDDKKQIPISMDPKVFAQAQILFESLGLTADLAIELFLRQSLRQNGLPFKITVNPDQFSKN